MMYNLFAISSKRTIIKKNIFLERAIPKEKAFKRKIIKDMKLKNDPIPIADQTKLVEKKPIELKYPLQKLPPSDKPSGWLDPIGGTEHLPFKVIRTKSKQLPVYSDIRNGGTKRVTILRRYIGDSNEIVEELRRLLPGTVVEEKLGRIEVKGHHVYKIKRWLKRLGF